MKSNSKKHTKKKMIKMKAIAKLTENPKIKGFITFEELESKKLKITYQVEGLTDGKHGFHIHEYGDLSEGCASACAHFNPLHKNHGSLTSEERHAGDLGNITSKNNIAKGTLIARDISLRNNKFNRGRHINTLTFYKHIRNYMISRCLNKRKSVII